MLVRCPACRGQKKVFKLGMIKKECTTCDGTGLVTAQEREKILSPIQEEICDDVAEMDDTSTDTSTMQGRIEDGSNLKQKIKKNR